MEYHFMINLEEFVHSIHVATASAGEALIQKNLDLLDRFFEIADEQDGDIVHMADIGRSDAKVEGKSPERSHSDRQEQEQNGSSIRAFGGDRPSDQIPILKPKMVAIQYPTVTQEGPSVQTVNVPLINLSSG